MASYYADHAQQLKRDLAKEIPVDALRELHQKRPLLHALIALANFGAAGSVIVALIVLSGIINGWMIVGIANLPFLPFTLYGQLLIAKLLLFGAMLAHAAVNRWRLTPRLADVRAAGDAYGVVRVLRISIFSEFAIALLVIALVSWLGTLEPVAMS